MVCAVSLATSGFIILMFHFYMQRHIYGHQGKNIQIFADNSNLAVNPSYIRSWLDILSQTPRVAPFLSKNDPIVMALKKVRLFYFLLFIPSSFQVVFSLVCCNRTRIIICYFYS